MRERCIAALVVTAALIALAAVVLWHSPEGRWVERLDGWPVVGRFAEAARARRPPPPAVRVPVPRPSTATPDPARLPFGDPRPAVARAAPRPASTPARIAPSFPGPRPVEAATPEPPRPLAARPADEDRLRRVRARLGADRFEGRLGPYGYLGDAPPPERWARLAAALDAAPALRYGLAPVGAPRESVVVVSSAEVYRDLLRHEPRLAGLDVGGHASGGLAVVRLDASAPQASEATLVHELMHFVLRRTVGPALPSWLDEGLAEDIAQTPFDDRPAEFRWGEFRLELRREGDRIDLRAAAAGLDNAVRALDRGERPQLARLVEMDWDEFVGHGGAARYARALHLVRYLLDGGDARRAAGLRAFLAHAAEGGAVDRGALEAAIGASLADLEPEFERFVRERKATVLDPALRALAQPGERIVEPAGGG